MPDDRFRPPPPDDSSPEDSPSPPMRDKGDTERVDYSEVLSVDTSLPAASSEADLLRSYPPSGRPTQPETMDRDSLGWPVNEEEDEIDLEGVVLGGRYRLVRELGRGGMGMVYAGEHLALQTKIAVKVMLPSVAKSATYLKRFKREARIMSTVRHRNIVQVLDYGIEDGFPYIVMEHLQGYTVSDWIASSDALPALQDVDGVMRQLFDAFEAAHVAGVVHRDLKPDNIFITREVDGVRLVKVLDFGLAHMADGKLSGPSLTQAGMVSGTPEYMSPEQCRSLKVGPSSDLYAMGCVLTELLSGEPPFGGSSVAEIMTQQMFSAPGPLKRPAELEQVPPLVERLRLDLLAKRTENRPADIRTARARWNEAMSADATARRLPQRKAAPELGGRLARVPDWTQPGKRVVQADPLLSQTHRVQIVVLAKDHDGINDACLVGLAADGVACVLTEKGAPIAQDVAAVLIDASDDVEGALELLREIPSGFRGPGPIVAGRGVEHEVGRLIEAGAGDIVAYPVEVSTLLRKLRRLLRRPRRS